MKDRFAEMKADYERNGPDPSNLRYGYVKQPAGYVPPEVFA